MKLREIIAAFESEAPPAYQEGYDNSGLVTGDSGMEISSALLCLDVTEEIIREALHVGANLIVSHHPVIFQPLKRITGDSQPERIILSAITAGIALYSMHTNLDNVFVGVNRKICQKLGLHNLKILSPLQAGLKKLVTYVPAANADEIRMALFDAGAGNIGNYDCCSFSTGGKGSFRAGEGTNPYKGEIGQLHFEDEIRIETVFPAALKSRIIKALLETHPYEEVAYDIFPLDNVFEKAGSGMIGELDEPVDAGIFLNRIKTVFQCKILRHSGLLAGHVRRIAVCGGSGSFLIQKAISAGADVFITADVKYHQFFDADHKLLLVDIGHYESEQFTIEIFYEILQKKLPNFAVHFSSINTSPIYYL
jgi:dinuclear metal center YbgI/SA1388 family protein